MCTLTSFLPNSIFESVKVFNVFFRVFNSNSDSETPIDFKFSVYGCSFEPHKPQGSPLIKFWRSAAYLEILFSKSKILAASATDSS